MHDVLHTIGTGALFQATAAPYLLLDTELRIQAVNTAYGRVTGREREELTGSYMFEAFPDNPAGPGDGVTNLGASLELVLRTARPHEMGIQRYDIPDPAAPGSFLPRTWCPVNSPVPDSEGRVVGVVHHVEEVTGGCHALVRAHGRQRALGGVRRPGQRAAMAEAAAAGAERTAEVMYRTAAMREAIAQQYQLMADNAVGLIAGHYRRRAQRLLALAGRARRFAEEETAVVARHRAGR